jgi:hypothetical protein
MADELDHYKQLLMDNRRKKHPLANEARAYLAQSEPEGPTDEDLDELFTEIDQSGESESWRPFARTVLARWGRAQPAPEYPSDKELLKLMPESMQDEFSYAAKVCSDATGGQVKPRIFRVALNTAALEYVQAVLAHYTS